ncbi:IucA/IucC family protein [Kangiella shandongensis]|uniref:IucA/IucC family protein n=1 Tax=Kangiella shandongensis TaxID=2763258 RepID=UPI001CBAFF81|nr:IucA/IucC family protein [Kangiella shandongensis]
MKQGLSQQNLWHLANQDLMARALSEFIYEEELSASEKEPGIFEVAVGEEAVYQFSAYQSRWSCLNIDKESLLRNKQPCTDALRFCLDLKQALKVDDIIFGNWLEDVQNTLNNDLNRLQKFQRYTSSELLKLAETNFQGLLDAHPKIVANRGRLGWGHQDNLRYAPESLNPFQLEFIAAKKSTLVAGHDKTFDNQSLLLGMMNNQQYQALQDKLERALTGSQYDKKDYCIMPCHPWQFEHHIKPQFQWALQNLELIELGITGDFYQPQQSIRTLSNVTRPNNDDVKLAITILNTSCHRGVPEKFIAAGHKISEWLYQLTQQDSLFQQTSLRILQEPAGYYFNHQYQKQAQGAPYRYHEMLGAIWRQSSHSQRQSESETHMLLSALLQKDIHGSAVVKELVEHSGLTAEQWLQQLFKIMSVPLYHLMIKYGVGVIAHGQNVVAYFDKGIPTAIAIKDFHGDLRLLDKMLPEQSELAAEAKQLLTKLPSEYLLHDLLTGHFVSVYRFLSPLFEQQLNLTEQRFYQLLAESLEDYRQQYPQYKKRFQRLDLFKEKIERVCLNKVRFDIGYQDNTERPLPSLATPLENPIHQGLKDYRQESINKSSLNSSRNATPTIESNQEQRL